MPGLWERWWARITGGGPDSALQRQTDTEENRSIGRYEQQKQADADEQENVDSHQYVRGTDDNGGGTEDAGDEGGDGDTEGGDTEGAGDGEEEGGNGAEDGEGENAE